MDKKISLKPSLVLKYRSIYFIAFFVFIFGLILLKSYLWQNNKTTSYIDRLKRVYSAQGIFKNEVGKYGSLLEIAAHNIIHKVDTKNNYFSIQGYNYILYLPKKTSLQKDYWIMYAWPSQKGSKNTKCGCINPQGTVLVSRNKDKDGNVLYYGDHYIPRYDAAMKNKNEWQYLELDPTTRSDGQIWGAIY